MYNMIASFFVLLMMLCGHGFAATTNIPESVRRSYALKFHEAFILQSAGLSTKAFYLFSEAYQEALKAGEKPQKVIVMDELFRWYRTYGSSMHLFGREPTGNDRIVPAPVFGRPKIIRIYPSSPLATIPNYESEWGNTPEQAGHIRDFMVGVGEVISGIFCVVVGSPPAKGVGIYMLYDGVLRMGNSLNMAWVDHERAALDLKNFEMHAKKAVEEP